MLEPHLRSVGATQTEVGLTFLILGGVYMVTTPVAGYVRACCILKDSVFPHISPSSEQYPCSNNTRKFMYCDQKYSRLR